MLCPWQVDMWDHEGKSTALCYEMCPHLQGHAREEPVPESHWWLRLDRSTCFYLASETSLTCVARSHTAGCASWALPSRKGDLLLRTSSGQGQGQDQATCRSVCTPRGQLWIPPRLIHPHHLFPSCCLAVALFPISGCAHWWVSLWFSDIFKDDTPGFLKPLCRSRKQKEKKKTRKERNNQIRFLFLPMWEHT